MGKYQRSKGARVERQIISVLNERFGTDMKRELEQVRSGGLDVTEGIPFSIEIKARADSPAVQKFLEQAENSKRDGHPPVAIVKGDRKEPIVVMYLGDWMDLVASTIERKDV